ncbi:hypothetical protein JOC73_000441 [Alkaliphilus hydrothermalis]|uniref:Uncharacterized protein n=1 Tax=Alkaliphilus hydrothermalis TaxID=1482730 RepID=A0ABS2NLZ7_9FIRM|nr:hypothetical protein [Alkaliphilus hydrothermalis]
MKGLILSGGRNENDAIDEQLSKAVVTNFK